MIEIRPAQDSDLSILRKIAIQTQVDTFGAFNTPQNMEAYIQSAYSAERFEKEMKEPDAIYYIAWDDRTAAGFLRLRVTPEAEAYLGKNAVELQRLYVTQDYQGKKVGSLLMETALTYSRRRKYEWLWLGVWEKNYKAQEFYRKWGFVRFSEHVFQMGDDPQTDWLLKLKL